MTKYLSIAMALVLVSLCAFAQKGRNYQDYVQTIESTWDEYAEAKEFEKFMLEQDAEYQAFLREEEEAFRKYVEEVKRKWNEFIGSSSNQWVNYSEDKSVRAVVNFEEVEKEPEKETVAEPTKEPEQEPVKKPTEVIEKEPEEETVVEPAKEPKQEPVEKLVEEVKKEPEEEIVVEPAKEPEQEPVKKLVEEVKKEPEEEIVVEPAKEPEQEPVKKPTEVIEKEPEEEIVAEPAKEPEQKPVKKPAEVIEKEPEKETVVEPAEKPAEKKGQIVVEAVVPADDPVAVDKAKELMAAHIEKMFSAKNEAGKNVLEGQVKNDAGETVTSENVKEFIQKEALPKAQVKSKPIKSRDGVERVKVSVVIPMIPEHLRVRAEQYRSLVSKYCAKYHEDIPLVMAVIQTESYFNPLAKSHVPAYGLMQLVPRSGGKDAYNFVFRENKSPKPSYLYVPGNNLLLGIAYMHLLRSKYFYGIEDPLKQEYLIVASYNGGMGRVIRKVLKKYNVPQMSPDEVYEALRKEMPDETKDYLAKVSSRKKNYIAWK